MKENKHNEGFVLVMAILITMVLSIFLIALTTRVIVQKKQVNYSYHRERALALAESGIEVGLACLNEKNLSDPYPTMSGTIPDMGKFLVEITGSTAAVTITSTGYSTKGDTIQASRAVEIRVERQEIPGVFEYALFSGSEPTRFHDCFVDSYDSTKGDYSSQYDPERGYANRNGNIGTNSTSFDTGGSTIWGKTVTEASVTFSPVSVPDLPPKDDLIVSEGDAVTINTSGSYASITLENHATLILNGNIEIALGNLEMKNGSQIQIASGSTVVIYATGNIEIKYGGIVNNNQNPATLTILGTDDCEEIDFKSSSTFYGAIYARKVEVIAHTNVELYGSIIADTFWMQNAKIHYDEALMHYIPPGGISESVFVVKSWQG